ncbi:MAG: DNA-protecting protein DprA [Candidatus Omnitrophica bacterium CG07_land_8_20_14_0_80_50_8]|nr:MAG: DNA-protecting protein DprA [Candidatus Omnitrophica bacterium CG07_land_8_20_14_0_80_50_8]
MKVTDELRQVLALSLATNVGALTFKKLMEAFGDIGAIFKGSAKDFARVARLPKTFYREIKEPDLIKKADAEIAKAQAYQVNLLSILDPLYPALLEVIYDPPILLYVKGALPDEATLAVAIVGSRHASLYGVRMARKIAAGLAQAGVAVVSGMALGIDSAAHEGALCQDGQTVAVLGGGLGRIYPPQNKKMAERIAHKGAVISEYPIEMSPRPEYFPVRNRIISGLSRAVLVVEAGEKSGALITVDAALEQGRDVFAVPGNADSERSNGTHALIKQGAKLVTEASDILNELEMNFENQTQTPQTFLKEKRSFNLSPLEEKIFSLLECEPLLIDTLIEQSGLAVQQTISILSMLEMKGAVKELPGKYFARNH